MAILNEHQRYLIEEFAEEYLERRIGRRALLKKALLATGSVTLTATALFALGCGDDSGSDSQKGSGIEPTISPAQLTRLPGATATVAPTGSVTPPDPSIQGGDVSFAGPAVPVKGYLARPAASGAFPALIVIHENRGLLEHFKDVCRRYAKEGFVALAVDLASRSGDAATLGQQNPDDLLADLEAGVAFLKAQSYVRAGSLGVTGFCFGGGYTFDLAAASADMKAAVPYYGTAARAISIGLAHTTAAVLVMYGGNDTRITSERAQVEAALKASGQPYEIMVFDGAGHAFFNDTGSSYNQQAAEQAWTATLAWFRKYLS